MSAAMGKGLLRLDGLARPAPCFVLPLSTLGSTLAPGYLSLIFFADCLLTNRWPVYAIYALTCETCLGASNGFTE
ncbi:hypothetical protein SAMN04489740_2034 [Arthrobacter alpinus]|uniref:Uncharacterized protein n=1 Tax=Arthrobacter alpinus TaxID=656366 RepID=A0A1H5KIP7_9MICC|nr:hypothetical protein SAMN04489740_2034 [Arthrobacter alpinus]